MEPHTILGFFHFNPEPMSISFYCINRLESSKTKKKRYSNTHPGLFLPLWVMVMECSAVNPPPHGCQPCSSCMPLWHCIILALVLFVISRLSLTTYMHNCIKFIVTTKHILYFQFLLLHPLLVCLTNTFIILLIICKKHCFWYTLNEQKRMQILFCLFRIALECSTPQNQGPYRRVHHILGSSYLSPDDLIGLTLNSWSESRIIFRTSRAERLKRQYLCIYTWHKHL